MVQVWREHPLLPTVQTIHRPLEIEIKSWLSTIVFSFSSS